MDKKKIVINRSFGTFSLSHKAFQRLRELGQPEAIREPDRGAYWPSGVRPDDPDFNRYGLDIPRDDLKLVQVVEELSIQANGHGAELRIVEIPGEVAWEVESVGGREHVSEAHRRWS